MHGLVFLGMRTQYTVAEMDYGRESVSALAGTFTPPNTNNLYSTILIDWTMQPRLKSNSYANHLRDADPENLENCLENCLENRLEKRL